MEITIEGEPERVRHPSHSPHPSPSSHLSLEFLSLDGARHPKRHRPAVPDFTHTSLTTGNTPHAFARSPSPLPSPDIAASDEMAVDYGYDEEEEGHDSEERRAKHTGKHTDRDTDRLMHPHPASVVIKGQTGQRTGIFWHCPEGKLS